MKELNHYYSEPSPFEEEIKRIIAELVSADLIPHDGLVITQKTTCDVEETESYEKSERIVSTFMLNAKGSFVEKWDLTKETYYKPRNEYYDGGSSTIIEPRYLSTIMEETDFSGQGEYRDNSGYKLYRGWTQCVSKMSSCRYKPPYRLDRRSRLKGKALYDFLKEFIDKASEQREKQKRYEEECNRINAAYNAELELMKIIISEEFASKREALQNKMNDAIEETKFQEEERKTIFAQIIDIKKELSSLGLFAGKKKKELKNKIEELERVMNGLAKVSDVVGIYTKKVAETQQQEQESIMKLEKDLRVKYPLPNYI